MITEQKVIFKVTDCLDGTHNIGIEFDPPIAGEDSNERTAMFEQEIRLQETGTIVAAKVFDALKTSHGVGNQLEEEDHNE